MKHASAAEEKVYELQKQVGFVDWVVCFLLPHCLNSVFL